LGKNHLYDWKFLIIIIRNRDDFSDGAMSVNFGYEENVVYCSGCKVLITFIALHTCKAEETPKSLGSIRCMISAKPAFMSGIPCIQHIICLYSSDLPQDDSIRIHPEGIFNQI